MTLLLNDDHGRVLRLGSTAVLCLVWVSSGISWINHPNGAGAMIGGLLGFALLGLAAWIAPIGNRGVRIAIRGAGAAVSVAALASAALLIMLLRNGL